MLERPAEPCSQETADGMKARLDWWVRAAAACMPEARARLCGLCAGSLSPSTDLGWTPEREPRL